MDTNLYIYWMATSFLLKPGALIGVLCTPSESLDVNPIENLWHVLNLYYINIRTCTLVLYSINMALGDGTTLYVRISSRILYEYR